LGPLCSKRIGVHSSCTEREVRHVSARELHLAAGGRTDWLVIISFIRYSNRSYLPSTPLEPTDWAIPFQRPRSFAHYVVHVIESIRILCRFKDAVLSFEGVHDDDAHGCGGKRGVANAELLLNAYYKTSW
jgi:hypothetical protein